LIPLDNLKNSWSHVVYRYFYSTQKYLISVLLRNLLLLFFQRWIKKYLQITKPFSFTITIFLKQGLKFFDTAKIIKTKISVKDGNGGFLCSIEISRHQMTSANDWFPWISYILLRVKKIPRSMPNFFKSFKISNNYMQNHYSI